VEGSWAILKSTIHTNLFSRPNAKIKHTSNLLPEKLLQLTDSTPPVILKGIWAFSTILIKEINWFLDI